MSIQFNDTTAYKGLVQLYEAELGMNVGDIANNTDRLKSFTADVNVAWDDFMYLAFKSDGRWQFDDSNQTDYPIIKTNLVSGQKDYTFTTDQNSNLILFIYKVAILPSATATLYQEIRPVDVESDSKLYNLVAQSTVTGVPYQYDKLANGIFLDPPPAYNATNGLLVYINREASYFAYTDTTKKPGAPGILHSYFYLAPAREYARRNGLTSLQNLEQKVAQLEAKIIDYFSSREQDTRKVMKGKFIPYI